MRWKRIYIDNIKTDYEVSDTGEVRHLPDMADIHKVFHKGYLRVHLRVNVNGTSLYITKPVHRLVAKAFIPNPNNYTVVNHKNEIKHDNRVENLEWCTQKYNTDYSRPRTRKARQDLENNNGAVYSNDQIRQVCECICNGETNYQIANKLGMRIGAVEAVRHRDNWVEISKDYDFPEPRKKNLDKPQIEAIIDELIIGNEPTFAAIAEKLEVDKDVVRKLYYHQRHTKYTDGIVFNPVYMDSTPISKNALACAIRMTPFDQSEYYMSLKSDQDKRNFEECYKWWDIELGKWRRLNGLE